MLGPHFNRIMLLQVEKCFATIDDPNEVKYCRSLLNAISSFEKRWLEDDAETIMSDSDKRTNSNSRSIQPMSSIAW